MTTSILVVSAYISPGIKELFDNMCILQRPHSFMRILICAQVVAKNKITMLLEFP